MTVFGFSVDESIDIFIRWINWHQKMHFPMLKLTYEEIDRFPILAINKISKYLVRQSRYREVLSIWQANRKSEIYKFSRKLKTEDAKSIGFSYFDPITYYHRSHVSSLKSRPACASLTKDELEKIRRKLCEFTDRNGNYKSV
jgi:hypothetical protein